MMNPTKGLEPLLEQRLAEHTGWHPPAALC
jgi:hypothetical protein